MSNAFRYLGLIAVWTFQYAIAVWIVLLARLAKGALKLGALGLLLLCVPIIGWIVLAVLLLRRPVPATERRPSVWRPWLTAR